MRWRRWIALAALPVLLLAGDFFYWRLAVIQLRAGFEAWAAQSRAAGWEIRHGAISTGGWPDSATLRVKNLTVSFPDLLGRDGLTWGGDTVLLRTRLVRPDMLEVTPIGLHPLKLGDSPPMPVSADQMNLRLILRPNAPPRVVDVEAVTLSATVPGLGAISFGHLSGHSELKPGAGPDQPAVLFSVEAQPVSLPDGVHWGLGQEVDDVELEGVLNGPLPPWPSRGPILGPDLTAWATSWRDKGGSLELHRLAIIWGTARLDATATLALDEDLQPMGAGTGKIAGYDAALDALAANAVPIRSATQAAKAVLSLLANTPADDQPEQVEVPLTLQFRTLSVRQVPLVRLPELDWPEH